MMAQLMSCYSFEVARSHASLIGCLDITTLITCKRLSFLSSRARDKKRYLGSASDCVGFVTFFLFYGPSYFPFSCDRVALKCLMGLQKVREHRHSLSLHNKGNKVPPSYTYIHLSASASFVKSILLN